MVAVAAAVAPAVVYLHAVVRANQRLRARWRGRRTAAFLAGCGLVGLSLSPPLDAAADATASGHMVQHLGLGMYAPVALVLGAPVTLLLAASAPEARRRIRAVLRAPVLRVPTDVWVATAVSVGSLFVLYLTPLYDLTLRSAAVHHLLHVHFLVAGCLFAWAIAGVDPTPHRAGMPMRVAALVVAAGAHAFLAKLLYSRAPSLPPGSAFTAPDVETAAQLMYYGGHLAEAALAVALFAAWYRRAPRTRAALKPRPSTAEISPAA